MSVAAADFAAEDHDITVAVLRDLSQGFGVEDMSARGTCDTDYARRVISRLRKYGLLDEVLGVSS